MAVCERTVKGRPFPYSALAARAAM